MANDDLIQQWQMGGLPTDATSTGSNFGDRLMEFDEKFKLYLTTRERSPVYSSDVFVKASVLDFGVTKDSLIERMLF